MFYVDNETVHLWYMCMLLAYVCHAFVYAYVCVNMCCVCMRACVRVCKCTHVCITDDVFHCVTCVV